MKGFVIYSHVYFTVMARSIFLDFRLKFSLCLFYLVFNSVKVFAKVAKLAVSQTILDVKGQWKVDKRVLTEGFIILTHVPEEGFLVAQMIIVFHFAV